MSQRRVKSERVGRGRNQRGHGEIKGAEKSKGSGVVDDRGGAPRPALGVRAASDKRLNDLSVVSRDLV